MGVSRISFSPTLRTTPAVRLPDLAVTDAVTDWRNGVVGRAGQSWDKLEINGISTAGQVAALRAVSTSTRLSDDTKRTLAARINSGKEAMAFIDLGNRLGGGVGVDSRRLVFLDATSARVTGSVELVRG